MSWMRCPYYIWSDGRKTTIIEMSDWENSVHIPDKILDEFVVMRYAEMSQKEKDGAEKRAIKNYSGNFGCDGLSKKYKMPTVIEQLSDRQTIRRRVFSGSRQIPG